MGAICLSLRILATLQELSTYSLSVYIYLHPRWVTDRVEAEFEMVREVGLLPEELQVYASLLSHKDEETSDPSVVTVCRWWERAL